MSDANPDSQYLWTMPQPISGRSNTVNADIVDVGITLQNMFGTRDAARYLDNHHIDFSIAERVLLRPSERRKYRFHEIAADEIRHRRDKTIT